MTTYVVGTQSVHTAATLCDYLQTRVGEGDTVVAVNSLKGGDDTSAEDVRDGEDALNAVSSRLGAQCTVETHQYVRNNKPEADLLEAAAEFDADELVIGIRKRNPTSKVVFGSTAQQILLNSPVPMAVVPLEQVE
ncbi:universal stress protein UspA [Salinigranum rubrum]|uniref:Universal stress protein UspA n=1 Tax=Salinigranum rubrum TaxID=755307 RepID=A0A2I8VLM5_9EURY|nr:universal stress protein [Salinigranum rubrum]AUV82832.1 universal stress protein UspA [Salinigranum rubrum]